MKPLSHLSFPHPGSNLSGVFINRVARRLRLGQIAETLGKKNLERCTGWESIMAIGRAESRTWRSAPGAGAVSIRLTFCSRPIGFGTHFGNYPLLRNNHKKNFQEFPSAESGGPKVSRISCIRQLPIVVVGHRSHWRGRPSNPCNNRFKNLKFWLHSND